MSEQAKQGLSDIEKGLTTLITANMQAEIDKLNTQIDESKQEFGVIKTDAESIKKETQKSLNEAKNLVDDRIKSGVDVLRKEHLPKIDANETGVKNALLRLSQLEDKVEGASSIVVPSSTTRVVEFDKPKEEINFISYQIGNEALEAKFEGGQAKGKHVAKTEVAGNKVKIHFASGS